jgi:hypothetical protein
MPRVSAYGQSSHGNILRSFEQSLLISGLSLICRMRRLTERLWPISRPFEIHSLRVPVLIKSNAAMRGLTPDPDGVSSKTSLGKAAMLVSRDWYHFHAVRSRRASLKGSSSPDCFGG